MYNKNDPKIKAINVWSYTHKAAQTPQQMGYMQKLST